MNPSEFGLRSSVSTSTEDIIFDQVNDLFQPQDWPAMPGELSFYKENAFGVRRRKLDLLQSICSGIGL